MSASAIVTFLCCHNQVSSLYFVRVVPSGLGFPLWTSVPGFRIAPNIFLKIQLLNTITSPIGSDHQVDVLLKVEWKLILSLLEVASAKSINKQLKSSGTSTISAKQLLPIQIRDLPPYDPGWVIYHSRITVPKQELSRSRQDISLVWELFIYYIQETSLRTGFQKRLHHFCNGRNCNIQTRF